MNLDRVPKKFVQNRSLFCGYFMETWDVLIPNIKQKDSYPLPNEKDLKELD